MNIFGSDGFRCQFGTNFMTFDFIKKFSEGLAETYKNEKYTKPVLIGRDTRSSGVLIEALLSSVLLSKGINIVCADIIPTPGLSQLLDNGDYSLGVMITASHNPHQDNGVKLFSSSGFKLSAQIESKIEAFILKENEGKDSFSSANIIGKKINLDNAFDTYIKSLIKPITNKISKKRVLIDCSNGAYSNLIYSFKDRENLTFINNNPTGNNINLNCGALHAENLIHSLKIDNYDFGIAFDGDGDRAVFVSKEYGVIEVEKLVILFFKLFNESNNNKVVISEISNLALRHNLHKLGGELIETEVGDRFVVDSVKENNAMFGCEPSGHFHFPDQSKSMDGFVVMQNFLLLIDFYNDNINNELHALKHFNRIQENIDIKHFSDVDFNKVLNNAQRLINKEHEKVIIRKSMWDPVIRIYYDYSKENNFLKIKENIINSLSNES